MATRSNKVDVAPGRQAPGSLWSPHEALLTLERGSVDDDVAILKRAGILEENGTVSARYRNWGKNGSRTPTAVPPAS